MSKPLQIAIDGPAGAGKSTIAKMIADRLNLLYLDTGAMYRACALYLKRNGAVDDDEKIAALLPDMELKFDESGKHISLNGEDVSAEIRTPEVTALTSQVSAKKAVRECLVKMQQQIASARAVIMDGRDIGTVVLPEAQVKIFLTATPQARAERRLVDLAQKGIASDYETVLKDIIARDEQDTTREHSPLKCAHDAMIIDTSNLSIDDVIKNILAIIKNKGLFSEDN